MFEQLKQQDQARGLLFGLLIFVPPLDFAFSAVDKE
jgi:hypothetical protein